MRYSITYDPEAECILVFMVGALDSSLFDGMATEVARCIEENDCGLILNDMRQASLVEHVAGIYSMPDHAIKMGIARSVKRALVVSGVLSEFWFLETVFLNQGNVVKLFNDIDEARLWLSGEEAGS